MKDGQRIIKMYSYESVVSYSQVDRNGILPLYGILNFMQDCTNFHSESIGMGVKHMKLSGKAWLLISYKIKIKEPLCFGQKIKISTVPTSFKGIYGTRNFVIEDLEGNRLVEADSLWVLVDMKNRKPTRIRDEDITNYVLEEPLEGLKATRKIELPEERHELPRFKVLKTYIDNNGHMNNADYLRAAAEFIQDGIKYHTVEILYNKEAMEGEIITPFIHKNTVEEGTLTEDSNAVNLSFENEEGNVLTKIKIY